MIVAVPDLRFAVRAEAERRLALAGLVGRFEGAGGVVSQSPSAGALVLRGSTVAVRLSLAAMPGLRVPLDPLRVPVVVPDVVHKSKEEGERLVAAAGLTSMSRVHMIPDRHGPGHYEVTRQAPAAGSRVARGTRVSLEIEWVAAPAPVMVRVPRVIDLSRLDAERTLRAAGFVPNAVGPTTVGISRVTSQSPAAGWSAPRGSTVRFEYRVIPIRVPIPGGTFGGR